MIEPKPHISIQWHITTKCSNKCKHCYMYDEITYKDERDNELSDDDLKRVFKDITDFEKKWDCSINYFAVSGGDPLLRKNWHEFIKMLREGGKNVAMMGNPETLSEENLKLLKDLGVLRFQMSLDGMEEKHDYFRQKGSFRRTISKISALENHGISSQIMFTLYPENEDELFPLIKYLSENTPLSSFSFDIGTASGNADDLAKDIQPLEIKNILNRYLDEKYRLRKGGFNLSLREKSHFFPLLNFERGKLPIPSNSDFTTFEGCLIGWYCFNILSDGTALACRRMPLKIGKMPEQTFEEIFLGNGLLKKFRRRSYFEKCGECDFYKYCRGCPAYVNGVKRDPFKENPICFRPLIRKTTLKEEIKKDPPLSTTFNEEYEFIKTGFYFDNDYLKSKITENGDFQFLFLKIMNNRADMCEYVKNLELYIKEDDLEISSYERELLYRYFMRIISLNPEKDKKELDAIKNVVNKLSIGRIRNMLG